MYVLSHSVVSDSLRSNGLQPARLFCPWGFSSQEYWSGLSVQFSSFAQLCPTLCDPMNCSTPGLPVPHHSQSSPRLMSIKSVMPSSHLILGHPLLLLPPIPSSFRDLSNACYFLWFIYLFVNSHPNVCELVPVLFL